MDVLFAIIATISTLPILYISLVALQFADVASTLWALSLGGVEKNPIIKALMDAVGVVPALLLKSVVVAAVYYPFMSEDLLLGFLVGVYLYVVYNNIIVSLDMKKRNKLGVTKE